MLTRLARCFVAVTLAALALTSVSARAADDAVLAEGRALSEQFERGETAGIFARMTPPMQQAAGGATGLAAFREKVLREAGPETGVISEDAIAQGGFRIYRRIARRNVGQVPVLMEWTLDAQGRIAGFIVRPQPVAIPSSKLDYETRTALTLPFEGAWFVFWGGRTEAQNKHAGARDQRFAYDFVVVRDGRTHAGAGRRVDDYYCWDLSIRAPAPARVVEAVDGLPDQPPGAPDPAHPAGNHVMLDFGHGEYGLLAHFRQGSVRVRTGQRVRVDAELGRCGNSGHTTEPHLHFHLQDGPRYGDANGLPAQFVDYMVDGRSVARGEPVRGQTIERARAPRGATAQ